MNPALHIAVLDDEVDITQLLAGHLRGHGYRVTPVHDGRSLMELMPTDPPALVLLDLGLQGEDGLSIARQLREHWRCGLVIVTGRGDSVDKVVGLEVGADDYVTSPSTCANCSRASRLRCGGSHPMTCPCTPSRRGAGPAPPEAVPRATRCGLRVGSSTRRPAASPIRRASMWR